MKLKHRGLGSLQDIADGLWRDMQEEIEKNGHSGLTLNLEGAYRGIMDIIEENNISENK